MAVEVIMPQMGESIFEGTITKWLKKPGDSIERDEPLFEISTDKVDAEIPSPAAGVLKEIRVEEGKTVPIQTVVAVIDSAGSQSAAKSVAAGPAEAPAAPAASAKAQAPTAQPPSATRPESPQRRATARSACRAESRAASATKADAGCCGASRSFDARGRRGRERFPGRQTHSQLSSRASPRA